MTDITLYQFPIPHDCEKVRWALDLKGLDYKTCNLTRFPCQTDKPVIPLVRQLKSV